MFSFFSANKNKNSVHVVFNVGSDDVSYAVVRTSKEVAPKVLFSGSGRINARGADFASFFAATQKTLKEACLDIGKNGLPHLNFTGDRGSRLDAHFFLSSPWIFSRTKIVRLVKDANFLVDEKLLQKLISREMDAFRKEFLSEDRKFGDLPLPVENKIANLKLNGYDVRRVLGQKTGSIEFSMYQSIASKAAAEKFREIAEELLPFSGDVFFHSFGYSAFSTALSILGLADFCLLDITGEITDVIIAKDGVLRETFSVPYAADKIVRSASGKAGISVETMKNKLRLLYERKIIDWEKSALLEQIERASDGWVIEIMKILTELPFSLSPKGKFLIISGELGEHFGRIVKKRVLPPLLLEKAEMVVMGKDFFGKSADYGRVVANPLLLAEIVYLGELFAHLK